MTAARLILLLLVVCACRRTAPDAAESARLELSPVDAEVWLPTLDVSARVVGSFSADHCVLEQNGQLRELGRALGFRTELVLAPGANRVLVRCWDVSRRLLASEPVIYLNRAEMAAVPAPAHAHADGERAAWLDDAVLYGVVPPLYGAPPLQAVTRALPALADLGVRGLWLSPLFATPPGDFGYAVTDYFTVRQDYGTDRDLHALVESAHRLGLQVLLDLVPNHTSAKHRYFLQAEALGPRSHYYGFYQRGPKGDSQHYFDWAALPNLDYGNPEVGAWMTAVSLYWRREFQVDGYRVDAAWGIAQRHPAFYDAWSADLRAARPATLIAEASARDPFYLQHGFDAAYDWTSELGHWAFSDVFASEQGIAARLEQAVTDTDRVTTEPGRVLRFLNNNDTGARFVTRHGVPLTRVATVMLLTLPGVPCLFSFDEVGAEFEPYGALPVITQPAHPELRELHRWLIGLRHELPALHGPKMRFIATRDSDVAVYLRPPAAAGRAVLVALNFSGHPQRLDLPLPAELRIPGSPLRDLAHLARLEVRSQTMTLDLPALSYALVTAQPSALSEAR